MSELLLAQKTVSMASSSGQQGAQGGAGAGVDLQNQMQAGMANIASGCC